MKETLQITEERLVELTNIENLVEKNASIVIIKDNDGKKSYNLNSTAEKNLPFVRGLLSDIKFLKQKEIANVQPMSKSKDSIIKELKKEISLLKSSNKTLEGSLSASESIMWQVNQEKMSKKESNNLFKKMKFW